jgi:tetratricopeptide (TPR) repeat protein
VPQHAAVNPRYVHILTGREYEVIGDKPTIAMLPGSFVRKVAKRRKEISLERALNMRRLRCARCGSEERYNVGPIAFNAQGWFEYGRKQARSGRTKEQLGIVDFMQFSAYIRCKKCNGAGEWEHLELFPAIEVLAEVISDKSLEKSSYVTGMIQLYDGFQPRWASDGEEHLLNQLKETPADGFVWNRLGNHYWKAGRPELALAAFERSLRVDPDQMESHFSYGDLLAEIEEWELAAYHFRMALLTAPGYTRLDAMRTREMLAGCLQRLLGIHLNVDESIAFLPTVEELAAREGSDSVLGTDERLTLLNLSLQPDDTESFLPIAEMYMLHRRDEIPEDQRTFDSSVLASDDKSSKRKEGNSSMFSLGSEQRPIIVKVNSEEKGQKIAGICGHFGWQYIMGFEYDEDLTDLKKALRERMSPADAYSPCPCGSGEKYKFCCTKQMKNFDVNRYVAEFKAN